MPVKTTVLKLRPAVGKQLKEEAARRGVYMNELVEALILAALAAETAVNHLVQVDHIAQAPKATKPRRVRIKKQT